MTGTILFVAGLYLVGMLLIALEAFVIPGFGVTGTAGALIIIYTAYQAWTQIGAVWGLLLGGGAVIAALAFVVWVPRSKVGRRLTLTAEIDGKTAYDEDAKRAGVTIGTRGRTQTELKPSGFAMFGDNRVEVRTEGEWVERDALIEVIAFKDAKVVVETVHDDAIMDDSPEDT